MGSLIGVYCVQKLSCRSNAKGKKIEENKESFAILLTYDDWWAIENILLLWEGLNFLLFSIFNQLLLFY